jgi:hypothetical protein
MYGMRYTVYGIKSYCIWQNVARVGSKPEQEQEEEEQEQEQYGVSTCFLVTFFLAAMSACSARIF